MKDLIEALPDYRKTIMTKEFEESATERVVEGMHVVDETGDHLETTETADTVRKHNEKGDAIEKLSETSDDHNDSFVSAADEFEETETEKNDLPKKVEIEKEIHSCQNDDQVNDSDTEVENGDDNNIENNETEVEADEDDSVEENEELEVEKEDEDFEIDPQVC